MLDGDVTYSKDIFPLMTINSPGRGFSQEIKIKAWRNTSIKCRKISIFYGKRRGISKFQPLKDGMRNLSDMVKLLIELKPAGWVFKGRLALCG